MRAETFDMAHLLAALSIRSAETQLNRRSRIEFLQLCQIAQHGAIALDWRPSAI
jgi:hypothetical protein